MQMAEYVLNYGIQPSEFWALTRSQKRALGTAAETINRKMKG